MGCHANLQGIFPIQGSNLRPPAYSALQADSLPVSHWGNLEQNSRNFLFLLFFFIQVNLIGCNTVKIPLQGQTCWNLSFLFIFYYYYFLFVWVFCLFVCFVFCHTVPHSTVSLFPKQGSNPSPPGVEAHSLKHWTAREVPCLLLL